MRKEQIEQWIRGDILRKRSLDKEKVKSMIESSITNMAIVKAIPLTEQSAILIFRESYESIRQLGDAQWWLLGYEPRNHEVSMEILKETDIGEKVRLNHLSRFKSIRNDANYRGFKVTITQAKEILEFWDACSKEIISRLYYELNLSAKVILADAVDCFVVRDRGTFMIFKEMYDLLETLPNRKIILTGANDEQMKIFGLDKMPYEVFTLKHNPEKTDPRYFQMMLQQFGLSKEKVVYFEHNPQAVESAQRAGIKTYFYDSEKKDLKLLKEFLTENT